MRIETIDEYNKLTGQETLHPLVAITDLSRMERIGGSSVSFGFYSVLFKQVECISFRYGRRCSDFQVGTLVCNVPGRLIDLEDAQEVMKPGTLGVLFHPDLLRCTPLGSRILEYSFFLYRENEALHLSEREKRTLIECLGHVQAELQHAIDRYSQKLLATSIELMLDYCRRFYERQFITRGDLNKEILARFEALQDDYYRVNLPLQAVSPGVEYYADRLNLSSAYFSDMLLVETGKTVRECNQLKWIEIAKKRVAESHGSIGEIAYEMGFRQTNDFVRLFKKCVGCSPGKYRAN